MLVLTNAYLIDTTVRLEAAFTDDDDVATDPDTVSAKVLAPDGTVTDYLFESPSDIVRDGVGLFHLLVLADQAGTWCYRWDGVGAARVAQQRQFTVDAGCFE